MATTVTKINTSNNILPGSSSTLVASKDMTRNFGAPEDYVELHISDPAGKHLFSVVPFLNYKVPGGLIPTDTYNIQELEFDPAIDLKNLGISFGDYVLTYNILRPKISPSYNLSFFIKEISPDRTEIRLSTSNLTNTDIENNTLDFILEFQSTAYFKEFYINFGQNTLLPAVNIALDKNTDPYSILIKLLNPLPTKYVVNALVNVVDEISNPQTFSAELTLDPIVETFPTLRGPNFDLDLDDLRVGPTPYYNFNQVTSFQGDFAPQLQQLLGHLSASNFSINIDYANYEYENWVHYSSAARRLKGFQYKLNNIELFTSASSSAASSPNPTSQLDAQNYQTQINKTIQSFDSWEQYLFYQSGSYAWPKQNSTKPYINQSITSSQSVLWYNGNYNSASLFDDNNQNYLLYAMPGYIAENNDNELVFEFVASIGQMFDDIWIYIKAITDLYQAKNALDKGISKDLVYFALQSMGVNAYTDEDGNNVFQYLYGVNEDGTYKYPTGSYETLISASNYQMSGQDQQKGIYKRIYHSLPLLLKSKGTTRFIQYLNTIFGIPSTIMGYTEYGGVDKSTATTEYEFDRFTYGLNTELGDTISVPWVYTSQSLARTGFNDIAPNGIEFRFKAVPSSSTHILTNYTPQTLLSNTSGFNLDLVYTPIGKANSIYSGSKGNFGYLEFTLGGTTVTSSTVPIFESGSNENTSWYNILVQRRTPDLRIGQTGTSQTYDVYIKNNVWGEIGHVASASLTTTSENLSWYNKGTLTLGDATTTGSFQEFRLWSNYLSESKFNFHVLNPESYESNYTSSAYNDLTARFPLGNNLFTYNHSVTTTVASTAPNQTIQSWTASFSGFPNKNNYFNFVERYYANVANSGYANPVTDKIRIYSGSEYGTQLLPNKSIEVSPILPTTKDIHLLDASLSPTDEIDRDIIANLGSTYDIDEFIGDPRGTGYQELDKLRFDYFKKYENKYNYKDYIRLIEFFHNSLFRTLKDFTPARTNLATGIVIKPHLLERSLVDIQSPKVDKNNNLSQSIDTAFITSSNGGNYSQSFYNYTINGNLGPVTMISDARDFFTGELPSSSIDIHNDFDTNNFNPFAIGFDNDKTSSYSQSIWNVEFNPLLNNVSQNQISNTRKLLTLIGGNYGFISNSIYTTESFQYQDFTDEYYRHSDPRYNGSQTTSTNYNVFSTVDDSSNLYGKNAAIDKNTKQFAFLSEVVANEYDTLFANDRSNVYIKYLVDENSNLVELAKRNYERLAEDQKYNLYQVQNIFKSGETVNISLFDYQNPSAQANLDGNKEIFAGGFRFYPTLWRTGSYDLVYNLDPTYFPNGASGGSAYSASDFVILSYNENYGFLGINRRVKYRVQKISGTVAVDTVISYKVRIKISGLFGQYTDRYYTGTIPAGGNITDFSPYYNGGINDGSSFILSVQNAGTTGQFKYRVVDNSPSLTVKASDRTIISCSAAISQYYPGFYFSGSLSSGSQVDYRFEINKGDLIRFASGSVFIPQLEYEIIDVFPPNNNTAVAAFRISSEVNNVATSSSNIIDKYAFARKIPDETNIVIVHKKNTGTTSAGIAKNTNLSENVDEKIANIVSDLKNKLF
jgi:hypothetical protein